MILRNLQEPTDCVNILVGRKKVEWVAHNYILSEHAKMQLVRRDASESFDLKDRVLLSPLFWKTFNGNICIAFNLYQYIVVDTTKEIDGKVVPYVVTFVDTKKTRGTVIDKLLMTYKEFNMRGDL